MPVANITKKCAAIRLVVTGTMAVSWQEFRVAVRYTVLNGASQPGTSSQCLSRLLQEILLPRSR